MYSSGSDTNGFLRMASDDKKVAMWLVRRAQRNLIANCSIFHADATRAKNEQYDALWNGAVT